MAAGLEDGIYEALVEGRVPQHQPEIERTIEQNKDGVRVEIDEWPRAGYSDRAAMQYGAGDAR